MNKQPEVTAKTREKFIDTFWRLYKDNPVEKIKIDALARGAGYSRSTFYEYFTDIYDVLRQAEDSLILQYRAKLHSIFPDGAEGVGKDVIVKALMTLFDTYGERIMTLTGEHGDMDFMNRLEQRATPIMLLILGTDVGEYTDYMVSFVFNGIMGTLKHWYRTGKRLPDEKVFSLIYSMLSDGTLKTARALTAGGEI